MNELSKYTVSLSNCPISVKDGRVVKKSSGEDYNLRLLEQIKKQNFFARSFKIEGFFAPYIYNIKTNRIFEFEMEYLVGYSFFEYLSTASLKDLDWMSNSLILFLNFFKSNSETYSLKESSGLIRGKCQQLKSHSARSTFLDYLEGIAVKSNCLIPKSFCHGDLTFSNMIFMEKRAIGVIDFLDSFINSYWIDIIKLMQDTHYYWVLKYGEVESVRLILALNYINQRIYEAFQNEIDSEMFRVLEVMNYLRIEPYIPKEKLGVLDAIIQKTPMYENFNSSNLR